MREYGSMDSSIKPNKGFGLIELMIAMLMSLITLAILFDSVVGDLKAYEGTRGMQGLIAKSRMTAQTLRLYVQQAGYRDLAALKNNAPYVAGTSVAGWVWESGQILQGTTSTSLLADEKVGSDIITLRFSGATQSGIVACDGSYLLTDNTHEMTLYVNDSDQLICMDNAGAGILLEESVEFIELLYGTSDNNNRYFTANNISDWNTVNRIKIGLLLSQQVTTNNLINYNNYTIFNHTTSAANDTNLRTVVVETVIIGNQRG